ncbi:MAG: MFS transporter [Pseudonocardia sp.]
MSSPTGADAADLDAAADAAGLDAADLDSETSAPGSSAPAPGMRAELFGPRRRSTTIGLMLAVMMVAFEAMGVGTAMPAMVADLGALALYAWPFVAFMAAAVFGTAVGGRWCDLAGPRLPLLTAPLVFGAGLLVAATAGGMAQLLVGRVLQGLGAGALIVACYVLIAVVYPRRTRPAVFGLLSSAWVLPSLVGPPAAGLVTERLSWHWVFLGLVPAVALAVGLLVPAVRRLGPPPAGERGPRGASRGVVLAALGAGLGVSALSWAGQHPGWVAGAVLLGALAVLVPSMRRLMPAGVFRVRAGVPAVVASRGLLAGVFFTANSFVPLILTSTHGWSLTAAGGPLVVGSLGWSAAAAWQGRHPDLARPRLLRIGFVLVGAGVLGLLAVAPGWAPGWVSLPAWAVAGVGMGLGFSSVSYLLLAHSDPARTGFNTSAAQMSDQLTTATMIGVGGALLAWLGSPASALPGLLVVLALLGGCGVAAAGRTALTARPRT